MAYIFQGAGFCWPFSKTNYCPALRHLIVSRLAALFCLSCSSCQVAAIETMQLIEGTNQWAGLSAGIPQEEPRHWRHESPLLLVKFIVSDYKSVCGPIQAKLHTWHNLSILKISYGVIIELW